MSTPPAAKPASRTMRRCSGRLVAMPSTRISASASAQARQRVLARRAVHDQLGDQRVVVRRHAVAGAGMAVDAHAGAAGQLPAGDAPGRGREGVRVLGVDAAFERVAAAGDVGLRRAPARSPCATRICCCTMSMPAVISVTGCSTCSARVHLDEVEGAVLVQELEGADAAVADLPAGLGAALADLGDQRLRRCPAPAPPRAPSGGGAAASSRGCRARRALPWLSASTWISTWRGCSRNFSM